MKKIIEAIIKMPLYKNTADNLYILGKESIESSVHESLWTRFLLGILCVNKWDTDFDLLYRVYNAIITEYKNTGLLRDCKGKVLFCHPVDAEVDISPRIKEIL